MRTLRFRHACLVLPALVVLSCGYTPSTVSVRLALLATPSAWETAWGPARFEVDWQSSGSAATVPGLHDAGSSLVVDLPRTPPVAVRATPRWGYAQPASAPERPALAAGDRLATAGAVWTGATGGDWFEGRPRLVLGFETGATAEAVRRLLAAGVDLRDFSVARLVAESAERLPDDPWSLDVERVVSAIGARAMRETYVRARPTTPVALAAPPGRWYGFSPFRGPIAGGERWPDLPAGSNVFYSADGRRWIVEVDGEGRAWQREAPP